MIISLRVDSILNQQFIIVNNKCPIFDKLKLYLNKIVAFLIKNLYNAYIMLYRSTNTWLQ
nr:MAG TPA: hypothetical protein [Caudoviricetes sp.]